MYWYSYLFYLSNSFKMPLLHVMGVTATNQLFSLCFCFMQRETEADYLWALKEMNSCFGNWIQDDITIATDRELALMGAVSIALPNAVLLLCMWHIEKMCLAKLRSKFEFRDDLDDFFALWRATCRSGTKMEYLKNVMLLHDKISGKCVSSSWQHMANSQEFFYLCVD